MTARLSGTATPAATTPAPAATTPAPAPNPAPLRTDNGHASEQAQMVFKNLVAGGIAGAISRTTVAPLERTKILLQLQLHTPTGRSPAVHTVLHSVWQREGWRGMFKGNGTNIVRIIPYSAVQFTVYEGLKKFFGSQDTVVKLVCGALAGIASVLCTYPLDMVRTRLSLPNGSGNGVKTTICGCIHHIYATEGGLLALYRGMSPTVIGIAPYVALNFTVYESLKSIAASRKTTELSVPERLAYGGIAGAIAQTVTFPLDVIRRRMQVAQMSDTTKKYSGTADALHRIVKEEGLIGLYRGLLPNYLKVVPAIAVSFVTFESVKRLID